MSREIGDESALASSGGSDERGVLIDGSSGGGDGDGVDVSCLCGVEEEFEAAGSREALEDFEGVGFLAECEHDALADSSPDVEESGHLRDGGGLLGECAHKRVERGLEPVRDLNTAGEFERGLSCGSVF